MRLIAIILGVSMVINASAIMPENINSYSTFKHVIAQVALLSKRQFVYAETVDEINALINNWKGSNIRKKSLTLLKENGFDVASSKNIMVIEWGGGGLPYRALYLSDAIFFIRESENRNLVAKKISVKKSILLEENFIKKIIEKANYKGDISGVGDDFTTYIITIFNDAEREKVVIIYGASEENIKSKKERTDNDRDTLSLFDLIMKIKKSCSIKPGSGA